MLKWESCYAKSLELQSFHSFIRFYSTLFARLDIESLSLTDFQAQSFSLSNSSGIIYQSEGCLNEQKNLLFSQLRSVKEQYIQKCDQIEEPESGFANT